MTTTNFKGFRAEIAVFACSFGKHYLGWVGGLVVTLSTLLFSNPPHWLIWPWLVIGFLVSAFLVWRDEYRQKESERMFQTAVDAMASGTYPPGALLIAGADRLDMTKDLVSLCDDLERYAQHPFKTMAVMGEPLKEEEWLEFLQEAKRRGSKLNNAMDAADVRAAMLHAQLYGKQPML